MNIKKVIVAFLKKNPYPRDEQIHNLADSLGIPSDKMEEQVYSILSDLFSQGDSVENPKPFKKQSINQGMEVEKEHTTNPDIAEKITKDHLSEDENYYDKLKKIEGNDDSMASLKEILAAKGKPISGVQKDAKLGLMKELRKAMGDSMGEDLASLKKVTVAAPDKEGVEKGLDKAKELVSEMPENESENSEEEASESPEHEKSESPEFEAGEEEESAEEESEDAAEGEDSEEDLKKQVEELKAQVAMLMAKVK